VGVILINSLSLYPLYLIPILISHPRTNSKKGSVRSVSNRYHAGIRGKESYKRQVEWNTAIFNTAQFYKKAFCVFKGLWVFEKNNLESCMT